MIVSVLMENLGFDPPIGSKICYALLLINVGMLESDTPELDRKGKTVESQIKHEKIQLLYHIGKQKHRVLPK